MGEKISRDWEINDSLCSFIHQLIIVIRKEKIVTKIPIAITLGALAVLLFTNLGFPYSGQVDSLTPQRYLITVGYLMQSRGFRSYCRLNLAECGQKGVRLWWKSDQL